jgi:hypothetical protein
VAILEGEKKALEKKLKDTEAALVIAQKEVKTLRDTPTQNKIEIQEKQFSGFLKSYNTKCLDLDSIRDEACRHSIWYNEQLQSIQAGKAELDNITKQKDVKIQELESKITQESLQVILHDWEYLNWFNDSNSYHRT